MTFNHCIKILQNNLKITVVYKLKNRLHHQIYTTLGYNRKISTFFSSTEIDFF